MEGQELENLSQEIVQTIRKTNAETGNCFIEAPKVLSLLFPKGIPHGKELEAAAMLRLIDKMFRLANNQDTMQTSKLWCEISAYALNAIKATG